MGSHSRPLSVAFAGGGTGGHLYPMLSLAEMIRRTVPDARFSFFATERPIDRRLIRAAMNGAQDRLVVQTVRPIPSSIAGVWSFVRRWRASVRQCTRCFRPDRPCVVVGSGGYGSAPAICAARTMNVPCVLLNPDAVPGKANRYLARRADIVFAQWRVAELHFPRTARVLVAGCPIRAEFGTADRARGVRRYDLDASKRTLLVTGASQGASSINHAMAAALGEIADIAGWQFVHLAGEADVETVRSAYASRSLPAVVLDYTDHMADALAVADLVVTRAGASTLAEITALGVPSVIMPYPHHRDRHQYANAAVLTEANAAITVEDRVEGDLNGPRLAATLKRLMPDERALGTMGRAASGLLTPDAAEEITAMVLALVGRHPGRGIETDATLHGSDEWRDNGARDDEKRDVGSSVEAAA